MELRIVPGANVPEYFDNQTGEQLSIDGELIALTEAEEAAIGKGLVVETDFSDKFVVNSLNVEVLRRVAARLNRHKPLPSAITQSRIFEAYAIADQVGGMCGEAGTLEKIPPAVENKTLRDSSGRYVNQLDEEVQRLAADNPAEITRRVRIDKDFAAAADRVLYPKQPKTEPDLDDKELAEMHRFVSAWRSCPNLRPVGGFVQLTPDWRLSVTELNRLVEVATKHRLL